jgi:hypothetical protein
MAQATQPQQRQMAGRQAQSQQLQERSQEEILRDIFEQTQPITKTANTYAQMVADSALDRMQRAFAMAQGIQRLRQLLDEKIMATIYSLMNTPLGFMTDRMPGNKKGLPPYSIQEAREAVIEGLLRGVYPLFNEMNIISSRCYIAQEGYRRKVNEIPGLTNFEFLPGVPRKDESTGHMVIRCGARWRLNGIQQELKDHEGKPGQVLAIPSNDYMGPDAIIGKAARKTLKRVYEMATGSTLEQDDEIIEQAELRAKETPAIAVASMAKPYENKAAAMTDRLKNGNGHSTANGNATKQAPTPPAAQDFSTQVSRLRELCGRLEIGENILTEPEDVQFLEELSPEKVAEHIKRLEIELESQILQ